MADYEPEFESDYARFVLHPNPQVDEDVAESWRDWADEQRKREKEQDAA